MTEVLASKYIFSRTFENIFFFFVYVQISTWRDCVTSHSTQTMAWIIAAQKMKFSIKDFFSKCDQIRSFLRIWLHLLKKSLIENFIFCAVNVRTLDVKQRALSSAHRNLADPWSIWQNGRIKFFEAYNIASSDTKMAFCVCIYCCSL